MTRRTWQTTDGWEVSTGWDRMLQHFFLDISRDCGYFSAFGGVIHDWFQNCEVCHGEGVHYLFNNLDDKTGMTDRMGGMKLSQVSAVLSAKLTEIPESVLTDLTLDMQHDIGNHIQSYGTIGKVK